MKLITTCILCAMLLSAQKPPKQAGKGKGHGGGGGGGGGGAVTCGSGSTISMSPTAWCISTGGTQGGSNYNPAPAGSGWSFNFPVAPYGIYAAATGGLLSFSQGQTMSMNFQLKVSNAIFLPGDTAGGTCLSPGGQFVLYMQHSNDTTDPPNWKWWAHPTYVLQNGTYSTAGVLSAALQPNIWSDANGQYANTDATTLAGFVDTLAHVGTVGITFGGGCNFGHGTLLQSGGTASMEVDSFAVN